MSYIISHRGNGGRYKENTKDAILDVLTYDYVDGVEIDVHMTQDKKFVVHHNGLILCENKSVQLIRKIKYKHLRKCQKIDLLEDILKRVKTDKIIILDLKVYNENRKEWRKLIPLLKKYPNTYYLVSFSYSFITSFKKKYPTYKMGYFKGYFMNLDKEKGVLDVCFCHYRQYKGEEGVWTVNHREDLQKYKEKSIFLITDYPKYGR